MFLAADQQRVWWAHSRAWERIFFGQFRTLKLRNSARFVQQGRFAGATGTFNLDGQIDLNTGTFSLPWEGTISSVGSGH
jgi:hypothetical protein